MLLSHQHLTYLLALHFTHDLSQIENRDGKDSSFDYNPPAASRCSQMLCPVKMPIPVDDKKVNVLDCTIMTQPASETRGLPWVVTKSTRNLPECWYWYTWKGIDGREKRPLCNKEHSLSMQQVLSHYPMCFHICVQCNTRELIKQLNVLSNRTGRWRPSYSRM